MSKRDFTAEEQTAGLLALVMWAGSETAAAKALRKQGISIPATTLRGWKESKADEYNALRDKHGAELEEEIVRRLRETALYAVEVERKAVEAAEQRLDARKDISPAQTAAALSKTATASIDKLLALTGRPSSFTDRRSPEEIVRGLVAAGVVVIEQPAELPVETRT